MSVLIEALSLVVRRITLDVSYPGGADGFLEAMCAADCPARRLCSDDKLVSVSFFTPDDVTTVVDSLRKHGIVELEGNTFHELAIIDQREGPTLPCDWLEWRQHRDGFTYAWLAGAAGALAMMIERIVNGVLLPDAVGAARERLAQERGHEEVSAALERAVALASQGSPSAERVESLGGGWVAEEALAIGVYCALAFADDFAGGVRLAVNHGGDSDSTGSITGNLLGAALGASAIPRRWVEELELRDVIERLADDLVIGYEQSEEWWEKYPGC